MSGKILRVGVAAALLLAGGMTPGGVALADPAVAAAPAHHAAHHGAHRHARRHARAQAAAAPIAPQARAAAAAPPAAGPAPVPNEAMAAPISDPAPQPSAGPSVFQLHYPPQGDGYVTGSSPQAMDDRNAAKATGVEVKVPLPQ